MSNINFFRVLQSGGIGGSSGGEVEWDDFTESSHYTSSINSSDIDVNSNQTEIFFAPSNTKRIDVYDFDTTGDVSGGFTFSTTGTTLDKHVSGFQFNPTGTKVFALMRNSLAGITTGIYQYNLTTAWDTSTMSSTYDEYVAFSTLDSNIGTVTRRSFAIDEDGLNIYFSAGSSPSGNNVNLYKLPLSTAFDLSSYGTIVSEDTLSTTQLSICSFSYNGSKYITFVGASLSGRILKNGIEIPGDQVDAQNNLGVKGYIGKTPNNTTFFGLNNFNPGSGFVSVVSQFTTSF